MSWSMHIALEDLKLLGLMYRRGQLFFDAILKHLMAPKRLMAIQKISMMTDARFQLYVNDTKIMTAPTRFKTEYDKFAVESMLH
jgi:hypothetical protein